MLVALASRCLGFKRVRTVLVRGGGGARSIPISNKAAHQAQAGQSLGRRRSWASSDLTYYTAGKWGQSRKSAATAAALLLRLLLCWAGRVHKVGRPPVRDPKLREMGAGAE